MQLIVSTDGTRRVKPSVYFRPTAQPISESPAKNKMIQAMTKLRWSRAVPDDVGKCAAVRATR